MNKYGCVDGWLTWIEHHHHSKVGTRVGTCIHGYTRYGNEYVHRLLWASVHGPIPPGMMVDHIDRDTANNHISNLRLATPSQSSANRRLPTSGAVVGVRRFRKAWRAYIDGKHLGTFYTYEAAVAARQSATSEYHL